MKRYWAMVLLALSAAPALRAGDPPVDRYGQAVGEDWPGKIRSDEQLAADAVREWPDLKACALDGDRYDRYGGVREGPACSSNGWFRVQETAGRWWFVTPEGHRYFMQGLDSINWNEGGYSTPLEDPSAPGVQRAEFTELPPKAQFPQAYLLHGRVNFLAANLQRKYGTNFPARIDEVTLLRLRQWGFNSTAKWGWGAKLPDVPFIEDCGLTGVARIGRAIDPYAETLAVIAERSVAQVCQRRRDDRFLIAYACENENGWSAQTVADILKLGEASAAKRALLDAISGRRGQPGAPWGLGDMPVAELMRRPLDASALTKEEVDAFLLASSLRYHRILTALFKKHDPNHLFMGAAHCPWQALPWIEGCARETDFVGLNTYDIAAEWLDELQASFRIWKKPYAVLEYSFVTASRGYRRYNSRNTVRSEEARGLAFRHFAEHEAAKPECVGLGYFIYWDQPVTRRSLPDGESYNFGLVNPCDQPYAAMLGQVRESNRRQFAVHEGALAPFALPDPLALVRTPAESALWAPFLPKSGSNKVGTDHENAPYFNGKDVRLKIGTDDVARPGAYAAGVIAAPAASGFQRFSATVYHWSKAPEQDLAQFFLLEASADGVSFRPVALHFEQTADTVFREYRMTPAAPLGADARYLRVSLKTTKATPLWANQLGLIDVR